MADINLRAQPLNVFGGVGDDMVITLTVVDADGAAIDVSGYTISADVLRAGSSIATFTDAVSGAGNNVITLTLSDAQTTSIGTERQLRWSLSMTTGGLTEQWVGGKFELLNPGHPRAVGNNAATLTYTTGDVTVTLGAISTSALDGRYIPDVYVATALTNDGAGDSTFASNFTGTDNTVALQAAVDAAEAAGQGLLIPPGVYRITDTITVGDISISAWGVTILADITDKVSAAFDLDGCSGNVIEGLFINGAGYLPLAGFKFTTTDNQHLRLQGCRVIKCRYGWYCDEAEVMNQVTFDHCKFNSNLRAGGWLSSYSAPDSYAQSGPILNIGTVYNGNGIPAFLVSAPATTYEGTTVLSAGDDWGTQVFMQGFANASFVGGQISGHGDPALLSLATFQSGNGLTILGTDIEDLGNPVSTDGGAVDTGSLVTSTGADDAGGDGAAIYVSSVNGVNIASGHNWNIDTFAFVRLNYLCNDVTIDLNTATTATYTVHATTSSEGTIRLFYRGDETRLHSSAVDVLAGRTTVRDVSGSLATGWTADTFQLWRDGGTVWMMVVNADYSTGGGTQVLPSGTIPVGMRPPMTMHFPVQANASASAAPSNSDDIRCVVVDTSGRVFMNTNVDDYSFIVSWPCVEPFLDADDWPGSAV